ncbi:hypothetical protein [Haloferula sp.]|uniref:hypothetical protein n=1 Tax=Haloferula sp. TaxID=2497595 RepID=UPI003C7767DB
MKPRLVSGRLILRNITLFSLSTALPALGQTTQSYPDSTGEVAVPGSPFPHIDITSVDVTVNAAETEITFRITLDGDPVATNWGKYLIALRADLGGTTTGNGWGRPINFTPGMTRWIGTWVDDGSTATGANGQIYTYTGGVWSQTGQLDSTDGTVTPDAAGKFVEITVPVANLGLDPGEVVLFDVYSSGGGGGDSAADSLSAPVASIADWGNAFTTDAFGETPNPALQFTMPGVATDSDNDGLPNTVEDNGGVFEGPNKTGTDPENPDSDGDLLSDGVEVQDHGTDPNKADTDLDGANDATEISLGSDPLNGPIPSGGATEVIGFDFFDYNDGGINAATGFETRVFDYDNSTSNDVFLGHTGAVAPWATSFGTEVICTKLVTVNGSTASRNFNGAATGGATIGRVENTTASSAKAVYAKVIVRRNSGSTFSGLSFTKDGAEVAFAGVRDTLNGADRNFGVEINGEEGAAFTGDIPIDRTSYCLVAKLDTESEKILIWIDPALDAAEPAADAEATFLDDTNAVATGIRLASGGGGRTLWDDLVVTTTWDALETAAPTDSEPDGLRDSWENVYSPGDLSQLETGGMADEDGLLDEAEQAAGTNPFEEDTDFDMLFDEEETNTGMFVSDTVTGSDPCNADTDGDSLTDGDEVFTYMTNPNEIDTDGDLEDDGFEIFQGTDPKLGGENSNSTILGLVQVNGTRDALYGDPIVVQTVQTEFGDNQSELNAGYATIQDGKLYVLLTGNLQDNFNKLEIFIDSKAGGQSSFDSAGNDGAGAMDDMFFDVGFLADYHLIIRRGSGKFDLDFADLGAQTFNFYEDILSNGTEGYGSTGTGVNTFPVRVGFDNSNTAGVLGGTAAADQEAAAAVATGLELCIDLADLGSPTDSLKVMAVINNDAHNFMSNQVLGGLPAGTANLGDPAFVGFDLIPGNQFFTVTIAESDGSFAISDVQIVSGGTQLQVTVDGLTEGNDYVLESSTSLKTDGSPGSFATIPGSAFTASSTSEVRTTAITPGTQPRLFVRAADAPGS